MPLMNNKAPPFGPHYGMSSAELIALREYLDEHLAKGFIRSSSSPADSPVLFVKNTDGSLRLCVDYRDLNSITTKNRYPVPLINETLDRLQDSYIYTKLNLCGAYNLLRITEEEWKTAFRTRYGLFECLVIPFGLTDASATFQNFMNDTLRKHLDIFCAVYLDDIRVSSNTLKAHHTQVRAVLTKLQEVAVFCKPEKCEFHVTSTGFLGYVVSAQGVSMDTDKVNAILAWNTTISVKDI